MRKVRKDRWTNRAELKTKFKGNRVKLEHPQVRRQLALSSMGTLYQPEQVEWIITGPVDLPPDLPKLSAPPEER